MSLISYLLSQNTNPQQLSIAQSTKEKFIIASVMLGKTDEKGFDHLTLPENKHLQIDFPNCIFDKIPYKLDSTSFLEYLGVKHETSRQLFIATSLRTHGVFDGEALFHQLRLFAEGLEKTLDETFFTEDLISDVNRLKHAASQTPGIMNNYRALATANKHFHELTDLDYLLKIYSERIANLLCLDRAINQYLNSM